MIARKWRPHTFEEVTGQEVITQTLRNALEYDRLHHAYLFSGARGVGKTTTARILAKALNCHKTDKPNLTPCVTNDESACPSCVEISESRSMDVLEIDAASHTGIDDVRGTIIDNINFNPARDRFKVFIVDEVHQLSKPAFNALLKTLEEPPGNVVFIMATTELHKVPETILSRCQEFEFRTIPLQKIFDRLKMIATAEKIDITNDALRELARSGEGSMRDAQSNFDQVISFSGETITPADVTSALGFAGVEILSTAIRAIAESDPKQMLTMVDDLIGRGHDLRNFCRDMLGLFRDLLVYKVAGEDKHLFEGAVFSETDMLSMSAPFAEADLLRFFNSLCETEASLREAAHPRYVLEVGLVKLIEMRKVATIESILTRLDVLSSGAAPASRPDVNPNPIAASAVAHEEKKTLEIDKPAPPPPVEPPPTVEEFLEEPPDDDIGTSVTFAEPEPPAAPKPPVYKDYVAAIRLPPLSADELEHIEDAKLDDAYDQLLMANGDDLSPLAEADKLAALLLGRTSATQAAPAPAVAANGSAAAGTKPALDIRPDSLREPETVEIPVLGSDPTEQELIEYAKAHPAVRSAMRVFRAKIVEVKRT